MNYILNVGFKFTEGDDKLEVTEIQSVNIVNGLPESMIFRAWSSLKMTHCTRLFDFSKNVFSDGKFIAK